MTTRRFGGRVARERVAGLYRGARRRAGRARARLRAATQPPRGPGSPPRVEPVSTHLGEDVDDLVHRAAQRPRLGVDPDYDLVHEHFDVLHYALQDPDVLEDPGADPVAHFLERGARGKMSPHPHFSMAEYLRRHPHRRGPHKPHPFLAWLRHGRAQGEIADPAPGIEALAPVLGLSEQQVVDLLVARREDLVGRLRSGRLGEMIARAAEIEPLVGQAWPEISRPVLLPFSRHVVTDQVGVVHAAQERAGFRRARLLVLVNRARWGGGRRIEGHLAHALARRVPADEVVVLYTDDGGHPTPAGRFPDGVREIDFATLAEGLQPEAAQSALVALVRSFHADAVVNVNSRTFYLALRSYGRALAATERIHLTFFCSEQSPLGFWWSWSSRYFYRTFDHLAGVITDSRYLADELVRRYHVDEEGRGRVHVLSAPVDPTLPVVATPPGRTDGRRPQVFWAGRFGRQKRLSLLAEVARSLPEADFRIWGDGPGGTGPGDLPPNASWEGRYEHLADVPLAEADAWLYTSGWDGVPSQLLEVAMTGIPVVGTRVGGTGEVLHDDLAWPVPDDAGAGDYARALRSVLADPHDARRKALELRDRLLAERTEEGYADQVVALLLRDESTTESPSGPTTESPGREEEAR